MKANKIITSLLTLTCFILFMVIELKLNCVKGETGCSENNQRLQMQNDSLRQRFGVLDENYLRLQQKADQLQGKLTGINQTIIQLKNQQHEKINAIDTLTNHELYGFFSNFSTQSPTRK